VENLPRKFGRYDLLELLAIGGMAEIYRAALTSAEGTHKELVIKRVLPHLAQNREFIEMFIDEARITMPLAHGNIVQVFEFGQVGEDYFLAMEFVRGRNLETVLDRLKTRGESMPVEVALFIAAECARGLDYAHRFRDAEDRPTGIIHRDISPQNVLIGYQGEVKITDFGIAKARSRIRQTAQGIIRGKACYLSPEQAECLELDGRSDQFSLGVVLYEMLTGLRPYEGETEVATLQKVRQATVDPPRALRPEISKEVEQAILKTLNRDPVERYENAGAFHLVLARALVAVAPEFTPATLADWMRGLFTMDITREVASRSTKDRLIERLRQENPGLDISRFTTGELLKMGTVAMQAGASRPGRSRRWWVAGLLAVLIAGAAMMILWGPWRIAILGAGQDAGAVSDAGAVAEAGTIPDAGPVAEVEEPAAEAPDGSADAADAGTASGDEAQVNPPVRYGLVSLNSSPWALVEIDGRQQAKETPLFNIRLKVGKHRLRFFNPTLKMEKSMVITVVAGQSETISVRLDQP
jgi:serine/threonine protein kinase